MMNAFDATVAAYAEVGRDLWTDVKDCASLGLAFVSPDEVCLALPADQLEELSFPPEEVPVSYTHLDVYKRQPCSGSRFRQLRRCGIT